MRHTMTKVRFALFVLLLLPLLLIPGMLPGSGQPAPDANADSMKKILGSDPAAWTITGNGGHSIVTTKGQPGLLTTNTGIVTLTGKTRYETPTEYRFTFRMHPQKPYGCSINAAVGCAELPDKTKQACNATLSVGPDAKAMSTSSSILPETAKILYSSLTFQAVTERSLAWSEEMRKTIEAQMATAPTAENTLFTLRMVVTKETYSTWVNGRFISRFNVKNGIDPSGTITLTM
jgi:hypothetical protein